MARGGPRKAGGPSKKKIMVKHLEDRSEAEVPEMPDPNHWIPRPQGPIEETDDDFEPEWSPAVVAWWEAIWTSPMSSEFVESDIYGLYMACVYLNESLNPYYKVADRVKNSQAWEATIKNYGLTPTARESLRWQVAQGTQAQNRTNQIRAQQAEETRKKEATEAAKNGNNVTALYAKFG